MNKKVKILVSVVVVISVMLVAAFTSKINSANKGIKIEDPGTLYLGGITSLIISPEEGSSITEADIESMYTNNEWEWYSSNENVIEFLEEENAIAVIGVGEASIWVTDKEENYRGELTITIDEPNVSFEEVESEIYDSINGFIVNKGGNQALTLKIENLATDYTVEWVMSDESILQVVDNDSVEALKSGVTTVKAIIHTAYGDWETEEATITVPGITLDKTSMALKINETLNLNATVYPSDAEILWSTQDENVATVQDGVVSAVGEGTTNIAVKMTYKSNDVTYESEAKCAITVEKEEENNEEGDGDNDSEDNGENNDETTGGIELSSSSERLSVGATLTLTATTNPEQDVVWTSSDESVAELVEPGCVYGVSEGTATITATTEDGKYTASCLITVVANQDADQDSDSDSNSDSTGKTDGNEVIQGTGEDNSTSGNNLPYTGFENVLKIAIVVIALGGIGMFVLYRKYYEI